LYSFLSEKKISYLIAGVLMVLIKEPATLVILAILAYESLFNFRRIFSRQFILKFLFLASPLLFFLGWMMLNKRYLGWYLWPHNVAYFSSVSFSGFGELLEILNFSFWRDFRFLLTLSLLVGFILSFFSKELKKWLIIKEVILFLLLIIMSLIFFWWGPFLPRYLLIFQPLFFIVGTAAILGIFRKMIFFLPILVVISLLFISCWFTPRFEWGAEINLNYLHGIKAYKATAKFLESDFSSFKILTTWPLGSALGVPELGYVNEPFEVIFFDSSFETKEKIIAAVSQFNLVWQKDANELLFFLQKNKVSEYSFAVFESRGEKISLYLLQPENY